MEAVVATVLATEVLENSHPITGRIEKPLLSTGTLRKNFKRKSFPLEKKVVYIAGLGLIGASLRSRY